MTFAARFCFEAADDPVSLSTGVAVAVAVGAAVAEEDNQ